MYNIIALMGEAGSGKDRTMQAVLAADPTLNEIISCTTRPMRQGEAHGVNYFYYTAEEFAAKIFADEMLECTIFNNWCYGTSYEALRGDGVINIGVFNPAGVESLLARKDCNVIVFRLHTQDKIRLIRQLNREADPDVQEVIRRFQADKDDFSNIEFNYINLQNNTIDDLATNVKEIMAQSEAYFARGQN